MSFQNNLESLGMISCPISNSTESYNIGSIYRTLLNQFSSMEFLTEAIPSMDYNPLVWSLVGSLVVGLSGIFPLLVIPIDEGANLNKGASGRTLKVLLSFAVGGLLGDVFLHLLPEAWAQQFQSSDAPSMFCGMWVLAGLLIFIIAEKAFSFPSEEVIKSEIENEKVINKGHEELHLNNNLIEFPKGSSSYLKSSYHEVDKSSSQQIYKEKLIAPEKKSKKQMSGYLNLMANCIDNFTHGLAVGGSFLLSPRVGILSTFAILVHEVPHEVGDFAILLRAGFSRWEAAKAQLYTGSAGLVGALTAVFCSGVSDAVEARTSWILPFTAGGFLHIALVTVLPELLREENPKESLKQMLSLIVGIGVMAVLTTLVD